jgi:hypothetical protein
LNGLSEVRAALDKYFAGEAVSEQNLSNWRLGGFVDWQRQREAVTQTRERSAYAVQLARASGGNLTEGAAAIAAGQLLDIMEMLPRFDVNEAMDPEKMALAAEAFKDFSTSIATLRSGDHDKERIRQRDEITALMKSRFEQQLTEYRDKVAERKRQLETELGAAKNSGGLTPESLARIEEAVKLL